MLLEFDNIALNSTNTSALSAAPTYLSVNVCGCDLNTPHASAIGHTTSFDLLLIVPGNLITVAFV